ncbi:putative LPS assembly protein LptD [Bacteroides thetaiotaomicron]|uniref:putative LPS assembly protein LptD n=1 Tax=Bacteroides thetaiotaomicron TaxID=818 RepID=UPI00232BCA54|nr:putative LPS assembly protein LptD [Bacteroides thetaiotaomicron]MDC2014035.1 putative LPS assembly protein LptD [Bacteroides thetaiotaomicron]MDC2018593.1 putative LPS assembly protein LptD [Bacteroides thetaiotaomicron]MDC2033338.1 putative LPS assembly protein LptD [Bacteroides thetaiotaomicron]MDC2038552.1 putative LPS assembly protein LptD [Bacteroides thetaiotaomicron]MDC2042170.1 putative LPS assembly protein LptD [Bacteroides thetaiotaomicron]
MAPLRAKIIISFILLIVLLMLPDEATSQRRRRGMIASNTAQTDSLNRKDSLGADTVVVRVDSVAPTKKQPLDAPVIYESNDSTTFTLGGAATLYGSGKVNYQNIELAAEVISMNLDSSTVHAYGIKDTTGTIKGKPVFKEGETAYDTETISYNFKSKKAGITDIITQQGEGYVTGSRAKKGANDEIFMEHGRYTTCDHHDHPHFYMQLTRAKVRPKKNVVTGPAYLVVEDVPLPLAVPFFFFPFSSSYSSGFIMPTYMDDSSRGFGLAEGGYYFAMSDIMDLKLTGDIFTKGSWRLSGLTNYNKRYKYSGTLQADYQVTKTGDKGMPDYTVAKDFKVVWNHRQDAKASPNSTFSASVNFSTSSYERSNINNLYNSQLLTQNTKTSSISYSRSFPDIGLTLSGTTNIAQTMRDSSIAVTLPDLNITLSRLFPFKRKKAAGAERWYEKISISYTGRLTNSIRTKDDRLFKTGISGWENAMNHNIPISATFTLFKYLQVNPSVNYTERWYTRKINQTYNEETGRLEQNLNDTINGFYRVSNYSASLSLSTKLYGMYKPLFMKKKEIQIRHVVTPQVSISGAPSFSKYWEEYTDNNGNTQYYSPFTGQPFGVPSREGSGTVSFSLANNLEMKYFDAKKDTLKKVSLIDDLSVNMSYNMAAKEKPWSPLSLNLRMKLTKNYTFNMNASFATYAYTFDKSGNVVEGNRTEWSYGRFGRFQGYGSSFNYTFNNDTWKKWFGPKEDEKGKDKKESEDGGDEDSDGSAEDGTTTKKVEKAQADPDGYQVFKMPWSLSFSYSFNIREDRTKPINRYSMRYPFTYTHNINMNGNIKISNNWSLSFNSGYDFQAKEITQTSCTISRDLHCFNLSASLSPFGRWKYYNVTIRANASILQDLKYEQRSQTQSNIQWY